MAEYIEREAAIAYIRERSEEWQNAFDEFGGEGCGIYADAYNDLAEDFYKIPAADVAPVRHGHWIEDGDYQICSECGEEHCWEEYRATYCDSCGAKMDGRGMEAAENE